MNTFINAICILFKVRGDYHDYSNFSVSKFLGSLKYKDEDHSSHHLCHQILVSSTSSISGPPWLSDKEHGFLIIRSLTAVGLSLTGDTWERQGLITDGHIPSSWISRSQKFMSVLLVKYSSASQEFTQFFSDLV